MRNVLVTGSEGFIGKNLCVTLRQREDVRLYEYDLGHSPEEWHRSLAVADVIFHLAGVNRPRDVSEYETGNAGFTAELCSLLRGLNRTPTIVFASSIQVELNNPYGASKRKAEEVLRAFAQATGTSCVVYRLKNLFGKWCRPNYNAVTATFCYNTAHDLPLTISDLAHEIELTYIDDVVAAFLGELAPGSSGFRYGDALKSYRITLGGLADMIRTFRAMRSTLNLPDFSNPFVRALYATYVSYLEATDLSYHLDCKADQRGSLAEFIKTTSAGQIFVSRTRPGVTRGNHFHHTKIEKFLVVQGEALIRFRHVLGSEIFEYPVRGEEYKVVDIPPGYTHSIQNVGQSELVTLFWADEVFDPQRPDTFPEDL
jgi:UDP-2-acetamido-2,6-beta-L-arabino-hexul-4-ose reductase